MDNVILTSASQISPNGGDPFQLQSTQPAVIDALVGNPLEPVEQNNVDGNFQAHMDVNYQAHDVALATAKASGPEPVPGLKLGKAHAMEIDDGYEHPDKVKSCCSMLNRLFLALAIVCFALFLCSIAFIVANLEGLNGKQQIRPVPRIPFPYQLGDHLTPTESLINESYFNLTHPGLGGIIIVLARRGAAIVDILIPYTDAAGRKQNRSIVLKGNDGRPFGSVRFGFDEPVNSMNLANQLPSTYPFFRAYNEDWSMYGDRTKPSRVRFVRDFIEVIYEFSSSDNNQFSMKTIVSPPVDEQIVVDPTNNIYFNLRGYGNLSTHRLNLTLSKPINVKTTEQLQQNPLFQGQLVDKLTNVTSYFYRLDRAGLGKNHIATLTESETKTTMNVFADHAGVIIDPFGVGLSTRQTVVSDMSGIRISPRQSPVYQPMSIYGPTLVVHPSQAIHTTWWQFDY